MIVIDHAPERVAVNVLGEFSLADFREFEELVSYKVKFEGPVDLYLDLREMLGFTLDMAWEEIRFVRQHRDDFRRIAIITNSQWIGWSAWLNQAFVSADIEVFAEESEAKNWLDSVATS